LLSIKLKTFFKNRYFYDCDFFFSVKRKSKVPLPYQILDHAKEQEDLPGPIRDFHADHTLCQL
jgi:hypothetical protein